MVIVDDHAESPALPALLSRARNGEAEAFCLIVQPHEGRLLRQALALCRDASLAEDLVAEALIEAWKSLRRYDGTCRFTTWLYSILLHRYQKSVRRRRSRPVPLAWLPAAEADQHRAQAQNLPAAEMSPAEAILQTELAAQFKRAIDALPEKHRQVIWLRFFEEASLPDIAAVLQCSVGTVKSRLHHALARLRKMKITLNLSDPGQDIRT